MNSVSSGDYVRFVIAGCLSRDYILPISGQPKVDVFGGNLAYASIGLQLWGQAAGLIARVGQDYPLEWLDRLQSQGFDLSGVKVISGAFDSRRFLAHSSLQTTHTQNPVQHFADREQPFPPGLLGYRDKVHKHSSRSQPMPQSLQISDIPESYLQASAVHICPIDYLSHVILPSVFRQGRALTITLSPDPGYMSPAYWEEIPGVLSEITAFITTEEDIRRLFQGRQTDLWEMAAELGSLGTEYILIRTETWGYCLYDSVNGKRWMVPNYPSQAVDPTGAFDAFAGGFLAGYRENYDPLEATVMGSIAASLVVEGSGVYFALDALPGLVDKRREAVRELVRDV